MRIIALDPGTHLGWARYANRHVVSSSVKLKHDDESDDMRLLRIHALLNRFKKPINLIVYEANKDTRHARAIRIAGQIEAAIILWARQQVPPIPVSGRNPTEVLKWLCGTDYKTQLRHQMVPKKQRDHAWKKRRIKMKDLKMIHAQRRFNYGDTEDHDRMDAEMLLRYVLATEFSTLEVLS